MMQSSQVVLVTFVSLLLLTLSFAPTLTCGQGETPEVQASGNPDQTLLVQWETYANSVVTLLDAEKKTTEQLKLENDELKKQIAALSDHSSQSTTETEANEKILAENVALKKRIKTLESDLSSSDNAESEVAALKSRAEAAEKATLKAEAAADKYMKLYSNAEDVLHKAQLSVQSAEKHAAHLAEELTKVYGKTLPPWLSHRFEAMQMKVTHHMKPVLGELHKRTLEAVAATRNATGPAMASTQTAVVQALSSAARSLEPLQEKLKPHWEVLQGHAHTSYKAASDYIAPHAQKVMNASEPYMKAARHAAAQAGESLGPHYRKVEAALGPHVKKAREVLDGYHGELQKTVRTILKEQAGEDVSDKFVWRLATVLLLLPFFIAILFSWPLLRKTKPRPSGKTKGSGKSGSHHTKKAGHRRPKKD
eukprot:TRINITY_DN29621_c0_g1_i1.p1 TRINITY_DN29621_c0_g1~~TRINITY_DN29621_c0_g1_i1.p1  ORF type:complete len:422 (-),score=82.82 TRINITY_DN29621_c0_g1_i1:1915-3180(-)